MSDIADLPDEVRGAMSPGEPNQAALDAISLAIVGKRTEAKDGRRQSGVEDVWLAAEEAYIGFDDANRMDFAKARWAKPTSMAGQLTTNTQPRGNTEVKSTAFVRLTARYVDAGAAKLGEILIPIDDKAFKFSPTPLPDMIKGKEDLSQVVHNGVPLERDANPEELKAAAGSAAGGLAPGAVPAGQAPGVPLTVKDLAEEKIALATKKAKAAETRIYDWMVESGHHSEMRKVIFDSARIGTGVLKAPYPKASRTMAMSKSNGTPTLQIKQKIAPASKWVDTWNIYPDPTCGENIHDGDFIFEVDFISKRQLRKLKALAGQGYLPAQIDKVLSEPPRGATTDTGNPSQTIDKNKYEIWYYYGTLTQEELECCRPGLAAKLGKTEPEIYAIVTVVNDVAIRATINPLDSGEFPYHAVPWQRRPGHWAGVGVGEQISMPQRMVNAATRALLNNAGKSAGSQIIVADSVTPADQSYMITPDKVWRMAADAMMDDARKAFVAITIPNQTNPLLKIIEYAFRLAEESSSIPLITQGQSGPTTPDTFGAAQLQDNNANQLLRSIGYAFDDYITEPVVRQYYEWLLLDPDVPDEEKGDWQINARGSIALVERAIQDQWLMQMGGMTTNPVFGVDPKRWFKLMAKSKRMNPADIQYSDEEQKKIDSQPPPPPPQVQVAQIRAESDGKREASRQQFDAQQNDLERQNDIAVKMIDERLQSAELSSDERQAFEDIKAQLAKTAMTLNLQRELSMASHKVDMHKTYNPPPVAQPMAEPAGQAQAGEAFTQ